MRPLPTIRKYPGLELAGIDVDSFGDLDGLTDQLEPLLKDALNKTIIPAVRKAAGDGAEEKVRPIVMASLVISGISIVISLMAILKRK